MENMNFVNLMGQMMGIVAVILGFISFQMHTNKKILVMQTATALTFCLHYLLIGAYSGMAMNALALLRNYAYYHREKKIFSGRKCPIFFAILMGAVGFLSWQGPHSLFVITGLVINTVCMSFTNPQSIRKGILVTSPMVLIYDVFVLSIGGIIYESVAIASAVIGILAYRRKTQQQEKDSAAA